MKTLAIIMSSTAILFVAASCGDSNARYIDLNSGKRIELKKDPETGLMVHAETGKPVEMYVDTRTNDTIYGKTGKVINGKIKKQSDGSYVYVDGDNKIEKENDGEYSAKSNDGDYKIKQTEDELKIKKGDYKKEVEKDGDVTIKSGDK